MFTLITARDHGVPKSPDGSRIVFSSARKDTYDLYQKSPPPQNLWVNE